MFLNSENLLSRAYFESVRAIKSGNSPVLKNFRVAKVAVMKDIVAMRYIFALLFAGLALPIFGQDAKVPPADNPVTSNWSKLGPAGEGVKGFALQSRGIRLNPAGQYELWVKILPTNVPAFVRRYNLPKATTYVLQHATVDCAKKLLLLDQTTAYDSYDKVISGNVSGITPSSKRDMVKPGSIGEAVFKNVCEDPSLLKNPA